jgi:uncharacterized protein YggE
MKPLAVVAILVGPWVFLWSPQLQGAESKRLSVTGNGRVEARPDVMELTATVTGSAEMTSDALKKFRDNRRRGTEAINKLKIEGLAIKGSGVTVLSNAAMQQMQQVFGAGGQQVQAGHTTFSETLSVVVNGIDRLSDEQIQELTAKILDAAKDAGLTIGQPVDPRRYYDYNSYRPQIVFFRLDKPEESRQKALDLAAQDARNKAEQMAKRLNVSLGKALAARDTPTQPTTIVQPYGMVQQQANTSASLKTVAIEAVLSVEYEILD